MLNSLPSQSVNVDVYRIEYFNIVNYLSFPNIVCVTYYVHVTWATFAHMLYYIEMRVELFSLVLWNKLWRELYLLIGLKVAWFHPMERRF